jgi:P-type Ca2+ transporter type 2C
VKWHQREVEEIFRELDTSGAGLSEAEAAQRLALCGLNRLAEEDKISRLAIFFHQFTNPLAYILLIAALVTLVLQEYKDAGIILAAVLIRAVIGFSQELKAEKSIRALKAIMVPRTLVVRDGHEMEIDSVQLVPGDIVLLSSGVRVPADLRLISAKELKIDEAMLTGESVPVDKITSPLELEHLTPGDQRNLAFMGTAVITGRGRGVVVETGGLTVLGGIALEVKQVGFTQAPLMEKFEGFARRIGLVALGAASALFGLGILVNEPVKDMFMTAVAATVATIPEGLPIVVTVALAIGVARMARQKAIIRKLAAVETLGSTTVICTDKTGTLTKNEMTVTTVYDCERFYTLTGSGYEPRGEFLLQGAPVDPGEAPVLTQVLRIGLLCNESHVEKTEEGAWSVQGDPTEAALIVSAMKAGLEQEAEQSRYPTLAMLPFESELGYMATLHEHEGQRFIFLKGAAEKLLDRCTVCMIDDGRLGSAIREAANRLAREGLRVLALAFKSVPPDQDTLTHRDLEEGVVLAGLQAMVDPPRPEAVAAIAGCKAAGIRVVMITGDYPVTAAAVAATLGIAGASPEVLTGQDLEAMSDEELYARVREVSIFARVAPHHKLRIVRQLMRQGEIVAVTGDGVNDAPALKAAHIGVAMGRTGTDVAKEAADMVIVDDNFASIFKAVEQGRIIFDNIRKVTFYLLPPGIAAISSILATVALGLPMPYLPAQLLWVNLVTNALTDISLACEPGEPGVVNRPPRQPQEGLLSWVLVERAVLVGLLIGGGVLYKFLYSLDQGLSLEKSRTIAFTTMVFFQLFQAWNSRSESRSLFRLNPFSNPYLFLSMVGATLAQLAVIYVPGLSWLFRTEPIAPAEWLRIAAMTLTVIVLVEVHKLLRRPKSRGRKAQSLSQ